jgi:hypothetical protein
MAYRSNINPMALGSRAYRGTAGMSAPLVAPGQRGSLAEDLGDIVADFAHAAGRGALYERNADSRAMLADKYRLENEQTLRERDAWEDVRAIGAALEPDLSNMAQVRRAAAVRGANVGLDQEKIEDYLASLAATVGNEDQVSRTRTLKVGPTPAGQAFTDAGRQRIRDEDQAGLDRRNAADNTRAIQTNKADNERAIFTNREDNERALATNKADNERAERVAAADRAAGKGVSRSAVTPTNVDDLEAEMNKQLGVDFDSQGKQVAGPQFPVEAYVAIGKAAARKIDADKKDVITAVAEAIKENAEIERGVVLEEGFFGDTKGDRVKVKSAAPDPLGIRN